MTIASENNRSGPYAGNGVTTAFTGTWKIYDEAHVQVIHTDADGVETVLTLTEDYTVSGVGEDSFTVTLQIAPATGEAVTLLPNVPFTQATDLENQGAYFAEVIERALDLSVQRDLQLKEAVDRAVKVRPSSDLDTETLVRYIEGLGGITAALEALGGITTAIEGVAAIDTEVSGVYAIRVAVAAVAAIDEDVSAVAAVAGDVATVADAAAHVASVAGVAGSVATVAGIAAHVTAVAGIAADVAAVAGVAAGVGTVAGVASAVQAVAAIDDEVVTVAGISSAIQTLAPYAPDIPGATPVETQINAATDTDFADADMLPARKATDGSLIKRSWASLKDALQTYFDTLYVLGTSIATAANFRAAASGKVLTADVALAAMDWVTLTDAATISVDHAAGTNRKVTLAGNRAFAAPTNPKVGWPLNIWVVQDATGSRVPTWDSVYDFGDYGTPTLSTGAGQADLVSFVCLSSTKFAFLGIRKRVD